MIVTCASCATRYIIDPQALGAAGRTVRCASCQNTWFQAPPADMPREVDLAPPPDAIRPMPPGSNLPAFPEPAARRGSAIGWAAFVVVVVGATVGVIAGRNQAVALWPPAARLYDVIGLPVEGIGVG